MAELLFGWLLLGIVPPLHAAPPAAGAQIINRAEATYVRGGQAAPETVYSNVVGAEVEAVNSLTLVPDQQLSRPPGATLALPHLLSNSGNVVADLRFGLLNLPGDGYDLLGLRLVLDRNGDGVANEGEPLLATDGTPTTLSLAPGESVSLLVLGQVPLDTGAASAVVQLTASTVTTTPASAAVTDTIHAADLASVILTKHADRAGQVFPGMTIGYQVVATNVGSRPATATDLAGALGAPILVDGSPRSVFMIRDQLPAGTRYVPGSLATSLPNALRLFRLASDPPFSYRSNGDDIAAVEVAVASPSFALGVNVTVDMRFDVRVADDHVGPIVNVAESFHDDGAGPVSGASNRAVLQAPRLRIGLAKRADAPRFERDPATGSVQIARVRFTFLLQNFGEGALHDAQVTDLLEGVERLGRYSPGQSPGAGEYTLVAGSGRVRPVGSGASGTFDEGFDGTQGHATLLSPGARLPVGGALEIAFDVRINLAGRAGTIYNSATAQASADGFASMKIADESVNGALPDQNGDGNPQDDGSPTPVRTVLPRLTLIKAAGEPRRVAGAGRRFEIDYSLSVTNNGEAAANFVRLTDNLNCTFRMQQRPAPVRTWQLVGRPVAVRNLLTINPVFSGDAPCDATPAGPDPYLDPPTDPALMLTDGMRHLPPGATEVVRFTVLVDLDPLAPAAGRLFDNLALAFSSDRQDDSTEAVVLAAAQADAAVMPLDPNGIVYDAVTREPVAGAAVTLLRESCNGGSAGPITAAELATVPDVTYAFAGDGSVSMTTGADGAYVFMLSYPPADDTCRYRLMVAPPPASGYGWPSAILPPEMDVAPGGFVQPQAAPPTGNQATVYFLHVDLGPALPDVLNNHIPLDPTPRPGGLLLEKTGSRGVIEVGDSLEYTLRLRNVAGRPLADLRLVDQLPAGFRYLAGSARLDGTPVADPAGAPGPELVFVLPRSPLQADDTVLLTYRAVAGTSTPTGPAINRATAFNGEEPSNEAAWRVRVERGVFADEAYLIGKVFLDSDRDGVQDHEEVGVPGVRLFLEDGTSVVTDVEGKYSLYGLRAITHVLKLDATTLPPQARPLAVDNRNAGRADSRFVDLKNGELHKANFAIEECCGDGARDEVARRRKALAHRPDAEGEALTRVHLELQPRPDLQPREVRNRAAAGELGPSGIQQADAEPVPPVVYEPVLPADLGDTTPSLLPPPPLAAVPRLDLESLLAEQDDTAGFVGLNDGDTLPMALTHVRVKGRLGSILQLTVNGRPEPARRVGKKVRIAARQLEAWEYIGVELVPGENLLQLDEFDAFGNARDTCRITLVAPGAMGRIELSAPRTAVADPATPVRLRVRLVDDRGVPVTVRTQLTLETETGRWESRDLNPDEPGTQVFIAGGEAEFALVPPSQPQDGRVRIGSGLLTATAEIAFLPELRPLIGAGILEGIIDLRGKGVMPLGRARANAFEQTLRNLSHESAGGRRSTSGRAAFFFKGTVKGKYLLTTGFDSDKDTRERLFRDIQPDKFYPIYGDSAVKTFDAQSTQRLYLRVDRERSYLLYGDFASNVTDDVGVLGAYNRAQTGLKYHHESGQVSANVFGGRDNLRQVVIEIPADGTSGPYTLGGAGELFENSEMVEILVRDRNQLAVVLRTIPATRFVDYAIEPLARRLVFKAPVASLDENLNPRFIRVTYESDQGGPAYWTAGADARVRVTDGFEIGASYVREDNPDNPATLSGVVAVAKPSAGTVLVGELAQSDAAMEGSGRAARLKWLKNEGDLRVRAEVTAADERFDNLSSGFTGGRTEATAIATYQYSQRAALRAEVLHSRDRTNGGERTGGLLTASTRLNPDLTVEAGLRASTETAAPVDPLSTSPTSSDLLTVRGRLVRRLPWLNDGQAYVEAEQDLHEPGKRLAGVGGDLPLGEKTRLYGRYELISSLGNPYALNNTQQNNVALFGVESAYLAQGRLFSELRLRDAISGREGQAVSGVRNAWTFREGLHLGASLEHTAAFAGVAGNDATAATTSLEYSGSERYKFYGSLEARDADAGDSWLNSLGLSLKLARDWSLLGRSAVSLQQNGADGSELLLSRQQLGLAWRQADLDRWNALGRYEYELRDLDGGAVPSREETHIVSLHLHYQPVRDLTASTRYAFKWGREDGGGLVARFRGNLLSGRLLWDFARDWDLSPQAAYRWDAGGDGSYALGVELGHQLKANLWLSVGYNAAGFDDLVLAGSDYLDRGFYLRLRFKFDEELLQ